MRIPITIALTAAFLSSVECQGNTMTPTEFGALMRDKGCETAEAEVIRQPDPDLFFGIMYDAGLCRLKSSTKALDHYLKSANRGNDEAMYAVFLEITKKGSPEHPITQDDENLSRYWLLKAGEKRNWRAAQVLALCFEKGCFGLPIDLDKSKYYQGIFEKYGSDQSINTGTRQQTSSAVGTR